MSAEAAASAARARAAGDRDRRLGRRAWRRCCALLPALPASLPAPVLVVVHVPPDRPSALPSCSPRAAHCACCEAEDKVQAEPGRGLLRAAGLSSARRTRRARWRSRSTSPCNLSRPSIDVLFESAADAFGARLLGIVLSGANADGAAGLALHPRARRARLGAGPRDSARGRDHAAGRAGAHRRRTPCCQPCRDGAARSRELGAGHEPATRLGPTDVLVLAVDDVADNLAALEALLVQPGVRLLKASSGDRGAGAAARSTRSRSRWSTCRCRR